jgi:hypothetical protein
MTCNGIKHEIYCIPDSWPGDKKAFAFSGLLKQKSVETENTVNNPGELCLESEMYDTMTVRIAISTPFYNCV